MSLPLRISKPSRVDFRLVDSDPLKQLMWDITGQKPKSEGPVIPGSEEHVRYAVTLFITEARSSTG